MSLQRIGIRRAIRDAIVGDPGAAPTQVGTMVSTNRSRPVWDDDTQQGAAVIYTRTEDAEKSLESPREYKRTARVSVEVFLRKRAGELLDDRLDTVLEEIEVVVCRDTTLGGCAEDVLLSEVEIGQDSRGVQLHGDARVTFLVVYRTERLEGSASTAFEWIRAHTDFDSEPANGSFEKQDDVTLQP